MKGVGLYRGTDQLGYAEVFGLFPRFSSIIIENF